MRCRTAAGRRSRNKVDDTGDGQVDRRADQDQPGIGGDGQQDDRHADLGDDQQAKGVQAASPDGVDQGVDAGGRAGDGQRPDVGQPGPVQQEVAGGGDDQVQQRRQQGGQPARGGRRCCLGGHWLLLARGSDGWW
jgi:hypothetical protein